MSANIPNESTDAAINEILKASWSDWTTSLLKKILEQVIGFCNPLSELTKVIEQRFN